MNPFDRHAASLAAVEKYYGAARPTTNWNGTNYPCTSGPSTTSRELGIGGFGIDIAAVVNIRSTLFGKGPFPQSEQTVTYTGPEFPAGQAYRIHEVVRTPGNPFITLHLVSTVRGLK